MCILWYYNRVVCLMYQVLELNNMIKAAPRDSPLYKLPLVVDPSNDIADVLVKALEWNMLSREWNLTVSDLTDLHRQSKDLLEALKEHLPDRVGGARGWNFEKAHSILHKVREIIMWGWSENTSCQGPEHAHIDIIKNVVTLQTTRMCSCVFFVITADEGLYSSTNRCWKT